jgi:hypothetical protein
VNNLSPTIGIATTLNYGSFDNELSKAGFGIITVAEFKRVFGAKLSTPEISMPQAKKLKRV